MSEAAADISSAKPEKEDAYAEKEIAEQRAPPG